MSILTLACITRSEAGKCFITFTIFFLHRWDIAKITETKYGCLRTTLEFIILRYADDNVLIAPSSYRLQQLINCLSCWSTDLGLKNDKVKSVCTVFKTHKIFTLNSKIDLLGLEMKWISNFKYLGNFLS